MTAVCTFVVATVVTFAALAATTALIVAIFIIWTSLLLKFSTNHLIGKGNCKGHSFGGGSNQEEQNVGLPVMVVMIVLVCVTTIVD